jgi:hypothetical protein
LQCKYYEECLDRAALENWGSFNCEHCDLYRRIFGAKEVQPMTQGPEKQNIRICQKCGKNVTIRPSNPFCASCLAKKSNEARERKKQSNAGARDAREETQVTHTKGITPKRVSNTLGRPKIGDSRGDLSLTLDFGNYSGLLDLIREEAKKQVRSIEGQALYILKAFFSDREDH